MEVERIIHLVATECKPELESKVSKWYLEDHFPMLMQFKGLKEATLYKRSYNKPGYPSFLAIYRFDSKRDFEAYEQSDALAAARKDTTQRWKEGEFETKWRIQYEAVGKRSNKA